MGKEIISEELLRVIEARVKSARPGPWQLYGMTTELYDPGMRVMTTQDLVSYFRNPRAWEDVSIDQVEGDESDPPIFDLRNDEYTEFEPRMENFDFIVNARQDSEILVDALKAALNRIHELEKRLYCETNRRRDLERSKPQL